MRSDERSFASPLRALATFLALLTSVFLLSDPLQARRKPGSNPDSPQVIPVGVLRVGIRGNPLFGCGGRVSVAILSTGIASTHPDLAELNTTGRCFSAFGNGSNCEDDHGRGTHLAGIVAGRQNTIDVLGVAYCTNVYAVRVLSRNDGALNGSGVKVAKQTDANIIKGLNWVRDNADLVDPPIRVVLMGMYRDGAFSDRCADGTVTENCDYHRAIQELDSRNITVVAPSGEDDILGTHGVANHVPSGYPEVIAVSYTNVLQGGHDNSEACLNVYGLLTILPDTLGPFVADGALTAAGGGAIGITIAAPGEERPFFKLDGGSCIGASDGILSTRLGGGVSRTLPVLTPYNTETPAVGSVYAAAHAAGIVALLQERARDLGIPLTAERARTALRNGADRFGVLPLDPPHDGQYVFDGEREGILYASAWVYVF